MDMAAIRRAAALPLRLDVGDGQRDLDALLGMGAQTDRGAVPRDGDRVRAAAGRPGARSNPPRFLLPVPALHPRRSRSLPTIPVGKK